MYLVGVRVRVRAGVGVRVKVGVRIRVRARVRGGHLVRREHIAAYLLPPLGQDLISPDLRERLHLLLPLHDQELGLEYLEGALLHTPCIDHA